MCEYATKGATLRCTAGSAPSKLQVTANSLLYIQGNEVATVSDKIPNTNIMPFGSCSLQRNKLCTPRPTVWTGFVNSVEIPGGHPLLDTSTIRCVHGGVIGFMDSGQMRANKVTLGPGSSQIEALKKTALVAAPFCQECEKKEASQSAEILRIYWMDEQGEMRWLEELFPGQKVTLCIEVEDGNVGKTVDLLLEAPENERFKGGKTKLEYRGLRIEEDNTAYINDFLIEYEKEA